MGYFSIEEFNKLDSVDNAKDFVQRYLKHAEKVEKETGLSKIAILTQGALESGWGAKVKGNNFFGIKWNGVGRKQQIRTKEVLSKKGVPFPVVYSVTPTANGKFLYDVEDYFMLYDTPADSFKDHANFFVRNPRYSKAWEVRGDYNKFFEEIAKAGYATAPNYADVLKSVAKSVIKRM